MKVMNKITYSIQDTLTMFQRCMLLSLRNLDAFLTGIGTPILMMLLFVYVLGGVMDVGDVNYVDYLVPGIILQCIGQCGSTTAISVNNDLKRGIIDRFRSMPIAGSSVLTGHALAAIVRNIITTSLILAMAFLIGFRPMAGIVQWIIVIGILLLFITAITWISIVFGLISGSAESANGMSAFIMFLPYLSSGFVPLETMPIALRIFAENQPMTPIIEAIRSLLMDTTIDGNFLSAILWCISMFLTAYVGAVMIYKKKAAK